jgi:hypothetical protein
MLTPGMGKSCVGDRALFIPAPKVLFRFWDHL